MIVRMRMPQSPPPTSKNMQLLEQHDVRQESKEDVGADREKVRAMRARVIRHMERIEYAHEQ